VAGSASEGAGSVRGLSRILGALVASADGASGAGTTGSCGAGGGGSGVAATPTTGSAGTEDADWASVVAAGAGSATRRGLNRIFGGAPASAAGETGASLAGGGGVAGSGGGAASEAELGGVAGSAGRSLGLRRSAAGGGVCSSLMVRMKMEFPVSAKPKNRKSARADRVFPRSNQVDSLDGRMERSRIFEIPRFHSLSPWRPITFAPRSNL